MPPLREEKPGAAVVEQPIEEERRALVCKACEQEISDSRSLFCMRASSVEQVFPNPFGHMRVILTAIEAHDWASASDATIDFTWFAGYAWTVIACAACRAHLGWLYEATAGESPVRFFGLLKEAIVER